MSDTPHINPAKSQKSSRDIPPSQHILRWWQNHLGDRSHASAKALSARLRRATALDALAEPAVHELACALEFKPTPHHTAALIRLALVLCWVRENQQTPLATKLGQGDPPLLSHLRFQRLIRTEGDEVVALLRRALRLAQYSCNVAKLGADLLYWNEQTRIRWSFDYFGAEAPTLSNFEPQENIAS